MNSREYQVSSCGIFKSLPTVKFSEGGELALRFEWLRSLVSEAPDISPSASNPMHLKGTFKNQENDDLLATRAPASIVLRLIAAWLVIVGHSAGLSGHSEQEFLSVLTSGVFSASQLGITIFFVLSGSLVAGSAYRSRNGFDFAVRRVCRLGPGWVACWLVVCLVVGPIFTNLDWRTYWFDSNLGLSMAKMAAGSAHWELPGLFTNHLLKSANGSVWTIPYEIALYAFLGLVVFGLGKERRTLKWVLLAVWVALALSLSIPGILPDTPDVRFLGFRVVFLVQFGAYFVGGWTLSCFRIPAKLWGGMALVAFLIRIGSFWSPYSYALDALTMPLVVVWLSRRPMGRMERIWDFSYGYYLWGWPVQQCLLQLYPKISVFHFTLATTILAAIPAVLSWLLVERHFLRRTKTSAPEIPFADPVAVKA
jgi:peptidoglycan/LPS O-acetylase OafA/YrhL